jgi:hypothetical protein
MALGRTQQKIPFLVAATLQFEASVATNEKETPISLGSHWSVKSHSLPLM